MQVQQLYNKNQFIITNNNLIVFQSYNSTIAEYDENQKTLKIFYDWDYSKTTLKHFYLFLQDYLTDFYNDFLQNQTNKKQAFENLLNTTTKNNLQIIKNY